MNKERIWLLGIIGVIFLFFFVTIFMQYNNNGVSLYDDSVSYSGRVVYDQSSCLSPINKFKIGEANEYILSSPWLGKNNNILIGTLFGNFYSYGLNGNKNWGVTVNSATKKYPILSLAQIDEQGNIYFGADDSKLYSYSEKGNLRWSFLAGGPVRVAPIYFKGVVYFGAGSYFYAVDAYTGKLKWRYDLVGGNSITSTAYVDAGGIYFGAGNLFYALNYLDGTLRWSSDLGAPINSMPYVYNGKVYAANKNGVFAINIDNKDDFLRIIELNVEIKSPLNVVDNVLFVGAMDGNLYAYDLTQNVIKWVYTAGSSIKSWPIGKNNVVYFGDDSGFVYALDLQTGELIKKASTIKLDEMDIIDKKAVHIPSFFDVTDRNGLIVASEQGFLYEVEITSCGLGLSCIDDSVCGSGNVCLDGLCVEAESEDRTGIRISGPEDGLYKVELVSNFDPSLSQIKCSLYDDGGDLKNDYYSSDWGCRQLDNGQYYCNFDVNALDCSSSDCSDYNMKCFAEQRVEQGKKLILLHRVKIIKGVIAAGLIIPELGLGLPCASGSVTGGFCYDSQGNIIGLCGSDLICGGDGAECSIGNNVLCAVGLECRDDICVNLEQAGPSEPGTTQEEGGVMVNAMGVRVNGPINGLYNIELASTFDPNLNEIECSLYDDGGDWKKDYSSGEWDCGVLDNGQHSCSFDINALDCLFGDCSDYSMKCFARYVPTVEITNIMDGFTAGLIIPELQSVVELGLGLPCAEGFGSGNVCTDNNGVKVGHCNSDLICGGENAMCYPDQNKLCANGLICDPVLETCIQQEVEVCNDEMDNDLDGFIDCDQEYCAGAQVCYPNTNEPCRTNTDCPS
ncbi:PQQ-like beta-propeller repeat protein, partial [Candidatus Woesearchaeota archaeon]|nr:PQQ-like beta-propeller repeat protein [Candidatus Woesearchaeota archaeon]